MLVDRERSVPVPVFELVRVIKDPPTRDLRHNHSAILAVRKLGDYDIPLPRQLDFPLLSHPKYTTVQQDFNLLSTKTLQLIMSDQIIPSPENELKFFIMLKIWGISQTDLTRYMSNNCGEIFGYITLGLIGLSQVSQVGLAQVYFGVRAK